MHTTRVVTALGAVALAAGLAACSATGVRGDGKAASVPVHNQAAPAGANVGGTSSRSAPQSMARVTIADRDIVYTAEIDIATRDVAAAAAAVRRIVTSAGGTVGDSNLQSGADPSATMTLKVPPAAFQAVLDRIGRELSKVTSVTQKSADVTGQTIDIASRLAAQRASVARVRALLDQANTIGDVVRVEGELTRREADLESLEGQLKALQGQVAAATVTVRISHTTKAVAPPRKQQPSFLSGLRAGWHAFTRSGAVTLAVIGAVLPFAVLAAAVAGAALIGRRRLATRPAPQEHA